ncbi:protein ELYS isoform X1 [Python bivittatus]|uniref:Protein ELYS isoform X1 n=1 Tax=Python bivittatus TaxID=176946 RepID=A0A9F2WGW7_PYTBI|nr:protein ELYS isoform X1 [Python bivittatus]
MRDLTAHVTSCLLQFPDVTIQALGEDEITIDCVLHGKFTGGRSGLACLACGPQLEIVSPVTGERLSAYRFNGVNEQLPTILAVKEFSWQKRNGLLIGLEETEGSVLCLYDLGISRVVKAVVLPGRVTAIEPIINHGGASLTTQHLHQCLRWLFGVAVVVTDVGHVLLIDLCLDDLSCNQNEIEASDLEVITGIPSEIPQVREAVTRKGRHLCFQLLNPSGTAVTTLSYIQRSNQLVVGFSDGYLSLWNMKSLKKEYHFQLEGGRIPVYAVTFQEPENDPRNCCYLWAVQSTQESEGDILSLHLLQLAFSDRRRLASGQIMYEGLEYCEERYSLDLTGGVSSLRGQTSNTKLIGCQTIEKFRSHVDREDSINEVISPDTSVSVFSWQVNTYGQGKPSTYLGIFDINRWYHAQMPDSLRPGEFLHNCPYFALWSLDAVVSITSPNRILDVLVHERSFSRGVPPSYPPPEQFFNPSTYNFDATCLLNCGIVHVSCTGFQKDTLHFLKNSGCSLNETIPEGYNRCLIAGLLSARFIDIQPTSLSQEEQFEAVLSAAIQTSSLGLLTSCIKQWTAEEQPDSAPNLRFVLEWAWSKVVKTKEDFIHLCAPLFDGSSNFIDPQTLQSLQRCELLLSNLNTVLNCFIMEAQELTEKGITDLTNKQVVTGLLLKYLQVVIWFCRSSLLPENLEENMHLSKPVYNYQHIQRFYINCRQKLERLSRGRWNPDCLMIDGMISQLGDPVVKLWQRDDGGTGKYPPPTLHALLDLYLLENTEELYKHAATIYLLLDIMHSCPNRTDTSVDSFPTAFAVPVGLVNLIQGFWCLDHNDYENSLSYLFHPATIKMSWQHVRIIQALMCQGEHRRALRYIQMMKPSMISSTEVALHLTVLLFNSCMVEAWNVLRQHSSQLNVEQMLKHVYEICQELGLMEDLLKLPFTETEQECLEKFLQTSTGINNHEFLLIHHLQRANYIPALQLNQSLKINLMNDPQWRERSVARNSILDHYGKVLPRVQRKLAVERARPYHLPSSLRREILRPKPLSTVAKQIATGNVITKATFINNVLSKIGEVWVGSEQKNKSLQNDIRPEEQSSMLEPCPDRQLPDPFVGTPIIKSLRKCSRLLDLKIQPISLDSPPLRRSLQESPEVSASCILSSPLHSSSQYSIRTLRPKNIARAPELKLLETPLVVKRAKALASTSSSVFPGFTPQSILRSSVRTTPLATPTASPGRSVTPPLRAKETKISFMEESKTSQWTGEADHEIKNNANSSEYSLEAQVEENWVKNRETSSISAHSLQEELEEIDRSSECITSDHLNKTKVSKEINTPGVKPAYITSEYHDAKSVDFGNSTFMGSQQTAIFSEEIVDLPGSSEREVNEIIRNDPLMEQQTSANVEQSGEFHEKDDKKYGSFPEGEVFLKGHLKVVQDTIVSFLPSNECATNVLESSMLPLLENNRFLAETDSQVQKVEGADGESVISIPDSEDIASIHSKNELEEKEAINEDELEKTVQVENLVVLQEKTLPNIESENQEVDLTGDGKHEIQVSEAIVEAIQYNELCSSSNLKFQYRCDSIEQQVTCELLEKDADESSLIEGDGELLLCQNNFTLILEGDDEAEVGDSTVLHTFPLKPSSPESEDGSNNQELITNSVSTVTSDEIPQNTAEVLPYVPEPIQVAIAENLLDVIKDTRSKEFSTEIIEQSFHESISKKVLNSSQDPVQNIHETNKDTELSRVENLTSGISTTDQANQSLNILPNEGPLTKKNKPAILAIPTLRRSARRAKETSHISENVPNNSEKPQEQIPQIPDFPIKDMKETKKSELEISANAQPVSPTFLATVTTRSGIRKPKKSASKLHKHPCDDLPSAHQRTARITRSVVGNQDTNQFIIDHTIQMTVNPKSANRLKAIALQLAENVISDQEVEPQGKQLSVTPRRGRRKKHGILKVVDQPETTPEKLPLPTPVRKTRSRKSSLPETLFKHDMQPNESQLPEQERKQSIGTLEPVSDQESGLIEPLPVRRKRGRPRKNSLNVSSDSQLDLSLLSPPDAGSSVSKRNTRSGALHLSTTSGCLSSLETSIIDTPKRRSSRVISRSVKKADLEKSNIKECVTQPSEAIASEKKSENRWSKITRIRKKTKLPSVSEESRKEEHLLLATENEVESKSTDMARLRLGEIEETLARHGSSIMRTRLTQKKVKQSLSLDINETFFFSPPLTKLTEKPKGEKAVTPIQLKGVDADLASKFVFSPPVLRSRKKQGSSISRIVEDLELPVKEEKHAVSVEALEKQNVKRSRATRSKATKTSKVLGKDSSWSPPAMEIKFISPFGTPADETKRKQGDSVDKTEKVVQKTLRRKEKRLSSYPKPVVRKKML